MSLIPVALPPGRLRLATRPIFTGSAPIEKTIGKGTPSETKQSEEKLVQHEHHGNTGEKGDTANIKQNTTNAGYFKGRRMK